MQDTVLKDSTSSVNEQRKGRSENKEKSNDAEKIILHLRLLVKLSNCANFLELFGVNIDELTHSFFFFKHQIYIIQ